MLDKSPLVSIIVRSKNEEKWISSCLDAIYSQTYKNFEVILVDNKSVDKTVDKAKQYPVKIVEIEKFLPGEAINIGIRNSSGSMLVCLSAHCIPVNPYWLENLLKAFDSDDIAGVYGRQEPMSFTPATDKRDLLLVFGLDKKVQKKDSFFHNANSMFRRDIWEKYPFDEKATNIEDRIWGREIIRAGLTIVYEPEASVYHYHGIHQNQDRTRCENVVRIIEGLVNQDNQSFQSLDLNKLKIAAIIPLKGDAPVFENKNLLEKAINQAKMSTYISRVIVATDSPKMGEFAVSLGAEVPFLRGPELSLDHVDLEHVYQYFINELEKRGDFLDIVVTMEVTYPYRPDTLLDTLIQDFAATGADSVLPARAEYGGCWVKEKHDYKRIDQGFIPRKYKEPLLIGIKGLGCVTRPMFLREGSLLGENVNLVRLNEDQCFIEFRS